MAGNDPLQASDDPGPDAVRDPDVAEMVYLIDDDPRVRQSLGDLLDSFRIPVVCFAAARDYLAYPRSDALACLVLDLELPELSGLDLQERLSREAGPPIIFISGHGDVPSAVRAMKGGAIEFLTKPVDTATLIAAIKAAFAQDGIMRQRRAVLAESKRRFATLTPREQEVFPLIVSGLRNKQAAALLGITIETLQVHRGRITRKMAARTFADLVRIAEKLEISMPRFPATRRTT
jgi:FixJ family two-component response regulator